MKSIHRRRGPIFSRAAVSDQTINYRPAVDRYLLLFQKLLSGCVIFDKFQDETIGGYICLAKRMTFWQMTEFSIVLLHLLCPILNSDTLWLYCAQCKYCDHKPEIRKSVGICSAIKGLSNKSCNRKM